MKHRVADLEGALLDHAVALAEGDLLPDYWRDPDWGTCWARPGREEWRPSERWAQGGPIIERERIDVTAHADSWFAKPAYRGVGGGGPTPLVAAMRAYVCSKFGNKVELP